MTATMTADYVHAAIAAAVADDDGLIPDSATVTLYHDTRTGEYYPEVLMRTVYGWSSISVSRRDLGTNAVLPAVVRAREWAAELGLPCRE
jgi:hypothetical protein